MRRLSIVLVVTGMLALVLPTGAIAQAAPPQATPSNSNGVIQGRIMNGTAGTSPIGSVPLSLLKFRRMTQETDIQGQSNADGTFRFEGLEFGTDLRYFVQAGYQDVAYRSEVFDPNKPPKDFTIKVYEATSDEGVIRIKRASVAIPQVEGTQGFYSVLEIVTFNNTSDRTFVGTLYTDQQKGGTLRFPLPSNPLDLSLGHGFGAEGVRTGQGGMISLTPMLPGELETDYTYSLPYSESSATLLKVWFYPVDEVVELIPQSVARPFSPDLSTTDNVNVNGKPHYLLTGGPLRPGQPVNLQLAGLPRFVKLSGGGPSLDTVMRGTAVALMSVIVLAVLGYVFVVNRRRIAIAGEAGWVPLDVTDLETERQTLVRSLADLEEACEAGRVPEAQYEQQRRRQRARLTDVLLLLREQSAEVQP
ncbi:MAG: hypothetical protein HY261_05660 [Chloroflexi bacterium]|nr:hypothetical protein [Chloroflexota bacterium]